MDKEKTNDPTTEGAVVDNILPTSNESDLRE